MKNTLTLTRDLSSLDYYHSKFDIIFYSEKKKTDSFLFPFERIKYYAAVVKENGDLLELIELKDPESEREKLVFKMLLKYAT